MAKLLLKNGRIFTMSDRGIIENGDILIENDKIVEIGEGIEVEDGEIYDLSGGFVYPGFIEAHSHMGLYEEGITKVVDECNEMSNPLTPEINVIDGINPNDLSFREAYENGITTVSVLPGSSNIVAGQSVVLKTYGNRVDDMVIDRYNGIKVSLGENPIQTYGKNNRGPNTRMAVAAKLREIIMQSEEYLRKTSSENISKEKYNTKFEAMEGVISGNIPIRVHAHRTDDIFTAIRIAKEYDIKLILEHCTEGHLISDELAQEGYPVVVGPGLTDKSKNELKNLTFKTVKELVDKGLKVAITTDAPEIPARYLPICVGLAVKEGLSEYEALKTITINPAEILRISNRVGSIEVGKDADIAVFNSNPIRDLYAENILTIIDGNIVNLKS